MHSSWTDSCLIKRSRQLQQLPGHRCLSLPLSGQISVALPRGLQGAEPEARSTARRTRATVLRRITRNRGVWILLSSEPCLRAIHPNRTSRHSGSALHIQGAASWISRISCPCCGVRSTPFKMGQQNVVHRWLNWPMVTTIQALGP